jgi:hypothetical protein
MEEAMAREEHDLDHTFDFATGRRKFDSERMTAKVIFTGDEPGHLDWYVVPPIYGRVGEYFRTLDAAREWANAQGWNASVKRVA